MKTNLFKFYFYKLILLLTAAVCAALLSFLFSATLASVESESVRNFIVSGIPMIFFFGFMYSMQSKIKAPEAKELARLPYYFLFTLKEVSVYLIFLVPFIAAYFINGEFALGDNLFARLYMPHSLLLRLDCGMILNIAVLLAAFALVTFIAHYIKVIRTYSQSEISN